MMTSLGWFTLVASLAVGAAPPVAQVHRVSLAEAVRLAARRDPARGAYLASVAYWEVYAARATLRSRELGLLHSEDALALSLSLGSTAGVKLQARGQVAHFRRQRSQALTVAADAERELRRLMGLKPGSRLVLTEAAAETEWAALRKRPLVRSASDWLDCLTAVEVLRQELRIPQHDWLRHQLTQARQKYRDRLREVVAHLSPHVEQILANGAQRAAFEEQMKARREEFLTGRGTLDTLLESQRFLADAAANEHQAIVSLNKAVAALEYAKRR